MRPRKPTMETILEVDVSVLIDRIAPHLTPQGIKDGQIFDVNLPVRFIHRRRP